MCPVFCFPLQRVCLHHICHQSKSYIRNGNSFGDTFTVPQLEILLPPLLCGGSAKEFATRVITIAKEWNRMRANRLSANKCNRWALADVWTCFLKWLPKPVSIINNGQFQLLMCTLTPNNVSFDIIIINKGSLISATMKPIQPSVQQRPRTLTDNRTDRND